ncbi:TGF-beta-activated kinase 1 and MAP3K7-binding protein 2 isoform X2 [Sitophilus oryzae]|uniref:TGF-beta-activated kinase 1 and MAP3K7-binding protein 2 isoform X2 n=1 Tax=Sitophilus oryzae TaxID=7048 RepID=A0A6J2YCM1_SITOR|nr:TGF-beta-activated kinase 1 and MAP3K7-binding protein 2 isoform X2 [Sitophilus oryzae]
MFAGTKRRSSNVRVMQIFHELKAQFPTIPDHILTSCITSYVSSNSKENLYDLLAIHQNQMGRASLQLETSPFVPTPTTEHHPIELEEATTPDSEGSRGDFERLRIGDMNDSVSDNNHNIVKKGDAHSDNKFAAKRADSVTAKRPNTLNIKPSGANDKERKLQLSGKCPDVHKLLNSPVLADKPPRSPVGAKRFSVKTPSKTSSPTSIVPLKKETVSTPTQTTDTLVNNAVSPQVNLSLNVNCQMGLVQSPTTKPKCTANVELTPTQPWLSSNPFLNDPATSPRSYTSVSLTLRPPSAIPQDPIDITSQNSSLTYSTSSFDKQKGLQSRLQITVGPGNASSVSSIRTRPRSFHMAESPTETAPVRAAGSLNDLAVVTSEPPTLFKQQARIDRMRIELTTANAKLVILRQEVNELEQNTLQVARRKTEEELEKQLKLEIKHMTVQCEQLAELFADKEFYNNIYTGPTGPLLTLPPSPQFSRRPPPRRPPPNRLLYQAPALPFQEVEDPKWNCSVCTFLNHPDLDKCEQCEMPRIYHVSAAPGDNIHIHVTPRLSRHIAHSWIL